MNVSSSRHLRFCYEKRSSLFQPHHPPPHASTKIYLVITLSSHMPRNQPLGIDFLLSHLSLEFLQFQTTHLHPEKPCRVWPNELLIASVRVWFENRGSAPRQIDFPKNEAMRIEERNYSIRVIVEASGGG